MFKKVFYFSSIVFYLAFSIISYGALRTTKKTTKTTGLVNHAQYLAFTNNDELSVILSEVDLNRIAIANDKIQSINGPLGLYTAKSDGNGAAYIIPNAHLPFTLFFTTHKKRNLSLFITPQAIAGKTIIFVTKKSFGKTKKSSAENKLMALLHAMQKQEVPAGFSYFAAKRESGANFFGLATLTPLAFYQGKDLLGIVAKLKNKTRQPVLLSSRDFFAPKIQAIFLTKKTLAPLAEERVYEILRSS